MRPAVLLFLCLPLLAACEPSDRRPGLWLTGEAEVSQRYWRVTPPT